MSGQMQGVIVPVTSFEQNCTLLFDRETKNGVVIDPGGDVDRICEAIDTHNLTIEAIWLTHGHIDHAGGAMDLKDAIGVDIIGPHKDDAPLLSGLEQQAKMFGLPMNVRNVVPDQWLKEGDTVSFGAHSFSVYHCPGHAPGHVIFYNQVDNFAQVGDVLFAGSIGRTDLPGGDHDILIHSIMTKVLPLGDDVRFICGHGPAGKIGNERRTNPFLQ